CNWIKASRSFLRYVLWEPASWPRRILMYMADVIDSDEHYFSTVACQAGRFNRTLVNSSLHFAKFAKGSPHSLEMNDSYYDAFTNAAGVFLFARKFPRDSPTLDRIDRELLHRQPDRITPGAWCSLPPSNTTTLSDFSSLDASDASTSSTTSSTPAAPPAAAPAAAAAAAVAVLLGGCSGYYPPHHATLAGRTRSFPHPPSLAQSYHLVPAVSPLTMPIMEVIITELELAARLQ
ncbi:hypothetical protein CLOP_g12069, partial [Closterium sp. NIES-67]